MLIRSGASSAGLHCLHQLCFIQVLFNYCDVDQGQFPALIFFSSLVLAVGVIGNVLVILVLISYKSMRTSTNLITTPDTSLSRAVSPPGSYKWYALQRKITEDGVNDLQVDLMPGFRLTWHYNKDIDPVYYQSKLRNKFQRYVYYILL